MTVNTSNNSAALPLLALAVGAFGIGTTEFAPMGMLPTIAEGVHASIPKAGLLVSAYGIGVLIAAPIMTLLLSRWPWRKALIASMAIFTLGNLLSALAPNYVSLLVARIVTSFNHGAFFGLGAVVAASLVPVEKQASAVAAMFMGLTIANIGGVPAATWLGQTVGWRESFAAIAVLGIIAMASLRFALPEGRAGSQPNVKAELQVLTKPDVLVAMLTTILSSSAMFSLYTYINPALSTLGKASPDFVAGMLVLIGIGFTIGNAVGGKFADRSIDAALITFLLLVIASMFAFPFLVMSKVGTAAALLAWGAATFAVVPPLQMRVMRAASGAPGLASSVNIGAFNLGNALGAALGGAVLSAGFGYAAVSIVGGVTASLALILVLVQLKSSQRRPQVQPQACS